ncbi:hypothetical protein HY418_03695 [Candidatus Kaiserbacteria bacterium]|nr:hypothetical protein [Candidatus Kaiserbacteria bacterium]
MSMFRVALFVCTAAFVSLAFVWEAKSNSTAPKDELALGSLAEAEHAARERIQVVGAAAAYEEFAKAVETLPPIKQHAYAHVFGTALFAEEDLKGVTICDARFSYGCYHDFLGRAIAAHGLGVARELNEACMTSLASSSFNRLACQHGIGHGIMAHLGYDRDALDRALAECRKFPYHGPVNGCYGGAIMEYDVQTILGDEARMREINDAYDLCRSLPEEYKQECVFWQPQWWEQVLFGTKSSEEVSKQMGGYCKEISRGSADLTRVCFEGIGSIILLAAEFDTRRAARLCDATSERALERLLCRAFAANGLTTGNAGAKGNGEVICEGLSGEALAYCTAYARNEANILEPRSPPFL